MKRSVLFLLILTISIPAETALTGFLFPSASEKMSTESPDINDVNGKAQKEPLLLVANKHSNTLCFIDPVTLNVIETIPTGPNPHEIILTPDQRIAYLSNYAPPGNTISVIEFVKRKHEKQIVTGEYIRIHGSAMAPDGCENISLSLKESDGVHVINMKALEVEAVIKTGLGPDPMVMWFLPDE